jgi:hypothetical protein
MAHRLSLAAALLPLFLATSVQAEEVPLSDCGVGCRTIIDVSIPAGQLAKVRAEAPQVIQEALDDCVKECVKLPLAAQKCFRTARTEEEFGDCEKASGTTAQKPPVTTPVDSPAAVVPDKLPARKVLVPSCETVCYHIMDLALVDIPAQSFAEARAAASDVIPGCLTECRENLDDLAKICLYKAEDMAAGELCDTQQMNRQKKGK